MIRAVLFDFDGVVADTFTGHFAAWRSVLPQEIELREWMVRRREGAPAFRIVQAIFADNNRPLDQESARTYVQAKNRIFRQKSTSRIYAEIPSLLDCLGDLSCRIGLVTGTSYKNLKKVVTEELFKRFHCIVTDGDTEQGKPDPAPYLCAADRLQVAPNRCLVIENAPLGIQAAKAAGMFCVALGTTLAPEELAQADVVLPAHRELLQCLPDLIAGA
ncbi:HAD family phosphatase [candidate division KSB1 bacterium]|nr:HAD family phosphatase [candidate division KSB1 bacterium]